MELFFRSPLLTTLAFLALIFIVLLYVFDFRRSTRTKLLRRLLAQKGSIRPQESFSVITRAHNDAAALMALGDHLVSHQYSQLQLVVLAPAENKEIIQSLRRYQRRQRGKLQVRVITASKNRTEQSLIRRYATNHALVWLTPTDRLSSKFFELMSVELLDTSRDAFSPRIAYVPDDTLTAAALAISAAARQSLSRLTNRALKGPVVVRRTAYLKNLQPSPVIVEHSRIVTKDRPAIKNPPVLELLIVLSLAILYSTAPLFIPYGWEAVIVAYAGLIAVILGLRLVGYPYSLGTTLTLLLLIPFWPILRLAAYSVAMTTTLAGRLRVRHIPSVPQAK